MPANVRGAPPHGKSEVGGNRAPDFGARYGEGGTRPAGLKRRSGFSVPVRSDIVVATTHAEPIAETVTWRRRASALAALMMIAGCGGEIEPGPQVTISLTSETELPSGYVFAVDVGGDAHELAIGTAPGIHYEIQRDAPRAGELDIVVRLLPPDGVALAGIGFTQRYSRGANHWVAGRIGTTRPVGFCIGTLHPVPLEPAPAPGADSLFVMYGSLPQDAVC
jgi:hypothetical protein